MKKLSIAAIVCGLCGLWRLANGDIAADVGAAAGALTPAMAEAEPLVVQGRLDEANRKILAAFPEQSRTAAQSFLLGNVLFSQDPKTAYQLHKRAAHDLPDEPQAQYEWAIEQHRAGEYAGAAKSYAAFSKAHPEFAPAYGLCAECLLRVGKTKEAVATWNKSEQAKQGTLVDFESLVCEVNSHRFAGRERANLLAKASGGDIGAAERLVALDCEFDRDWWNNGPNRPYLKHDLEVLRKTKFADQRRLKEILCAGDCVMIADQGKAAIDGLLRREGFLVGENAKLPQSGAMLSILLSDAASSDVLSLDEARAKWGPAVRDRAKASKDAEMYHVAGALYATTDQVSEIDRTAWAATGDARFAAALLAGKFVAGDLKPDDPLLLAAAKKFPDDAIIAGLVLRAAAKAGKPLQAPLIEAIKAEYRHFSPGSHAVGLDMPRPGAELLAQYFTQLGKTLGDK